MKQRHPAARRLTLLLQERIERGEYQPGTWLPTERALSEEFTVDRYVIRAALKELADHGLIVRAPGRRPWVSDQVKITHAVHRRQHRTTAVQTIAAILPQQTFYSSSLAILQGIGNMLRLREAPYRLTVFNNYEGGGGPITCGPELHALDAVANEGIAGVILWHMGGQETLPAIRRLRDDGVPVVFVDRFPAQLGCDFVGVDNRYGARQAVNYLLELGHRRIAHISNSEAVTAVWEREEGYREALRLQGMTAPAELIYTVHLGQTPDVGAAKYLLELPQPPTAVFAVNDYTAYKFIDELAQYGKHVPEDMSVVGFDDIDRFSPRSALLTTMQQPFDQIGQRAAELLLYRLDHREEEERSWQHILLQTPLIVRSTCRALEKSQSGEIPGDTTLRETI